MTSKFTIVANNRENDFRELLLPHTLHYIFN